MSNKAASAIGATWAHEPYWLSSFGGQRREFTYLGEFECDYEGYWPS